MLLTNRK